MPELTVDLYDPRATAVCDEWDTFVKSALIRPTWRWPVVRAGALGRSGRSVAAVVRDGTAIVGLANLRLRGRFGVGVADVEAPGTTSLPGIALPETDSVAPGEASLDPALSRALVEALESTVRREYGRRVRLVWYRQVFADMLPVLMRGVGIAYAGQPLAYFRNTFTDYETYLATLTSKRRNDQRRLRRRIEEKLTVEFGPVPDTFDAASFYALTDDARDRNHRRRFPPKRTQPRGLRDALLVDPDAMVYRYLDGDRLVAASLLLDHPLTPLSSAWGARDPRDGGFTGLWFDQVGRLVSWIIETGRPGLIGGMGLIERKIDLGLARVPQWSVLRPLAR